MPKTTSLTPLHETHGFFHKVITDLTLFGQIRPNSSILNICFVDISKHLGRSNVTIVMPTAPRKFKRYYSNAKRTSELWSCRGVFGSIARGHRFLNACSTFSIVFHPNSSWHEGAQNDQFDPLQNAHGFFHKVITDLSLFGQIRLNSILNIFVVDISKQIILIFIMYFDDS